MDSIKGLARLISNLGIEAVGIYKSIVNDIISNKNSNVNEIEHTLDYMLIKKSCICIIYNCMISLLIDEKSEKIINI